MSTLQTPSLRTRGAAGGALHAVRGTAADAAMIEGWAGGAGWSLGRGDLAFFTRHHPNGLLIGALDGRPVSAIATAGYANGSCFTGALIVDPGYRGRGIGAATFDIALADIGGRHVGLEAPPTMRDFFAARGFYTRWRTIAFAGAVPAPRPVDPHVLPMGADLLGQAAALDARCFPTERTAMVTDWAREPGRHAVGFVEKDRLLGYGVIRPAFGAARIGPLYATDVRVAASLFDALAEHAARHGARAIAMDIPEPNAAAMAICETCGLSFDTETLRMVRPGTRSDDHAVDLTLLYGLTSRELG